MKALKKSEHRDLALETIVAIWGEKERRLSIVTPKCFATKGFDKLKSEIW